MILTRNMFIYFRFLGSGLKRGLKRGLKNNIFWSEIGSGFLRTVRHTRGESHLIQRENKAKDLQGRTDSTFKNCNRESKII